LSFQTVDLVGLKASHAVCSLKGYVNRPTPLHSIICDQYVPLLISSLCDHASRAQGLGRRDLQSG
jgi:hypothetical protein